MSNAIDYALKAVANYPVAAGAMRSTENRADDFGGNGLTAKLAGIGMDPTARAYADRKLDEYWLLNRDKLLAGTSYFYATAFVDQGFATAAGDREVIIGSGYHAAVYAAGRVQRGFPKPVVLEQSLHPGGVFAGTTVPTFYLNSRNSAGKLGVPADRANLNYLPGAGLQVSHFARSEWPTNTEMAFAIRVALAQFAHVIPGVQVSDVIPSVLETGDKTLTIETTIPAAGATLKAGRVIDARGMGDQEKEPGQFVLSFQQFLQRMELPWPLRGLRRVAVIGGGDSGKCAVESLLGIAPRSGLSSSELDEVQTIDWYSPTLPDTCERWREGVRGRYQAIGAHLKRDRRGGTRLLVVNSPLEGRALSLSDGAVVDGRMYDLVVSCVGNYKRSPMPTLDGSWVRFPGGEVAEGLARKCAEGDEAYQVGPAANLPLSSSELRDFGAEIKVAMFRTGWRTAALAATLGEPGR